ncbi:MAG: ATP-binding cassette domain-containing protein, partial [Nodosilinea sp.]
MATHDLELVNIDKSYGAVTVLQAINLRVEAGEFIAIMGPSGCGKTTLLRVIAGLEGVSGGQVLLQGQDITALPVNRRNTPLVWQSFALFPHLKVRQNIA